MKTYTLLSLVFASAFAAQAQGTVSFINTIGNIDAPVYESDGVTKVSGPQFMAELLAGPSPDNLASIATTGFLQGVGAGYFSGGVQQIDGVVPGGTALVQVRVWNTALGVSFLQAQVSGLPNSWYQWPIFSLQLGGGLGLPPAVLTGLGTSPVYLNSVPEPSTLGLASLSAGLAILRKLLNKSMMTNRRCLTPLKAQNKRDNSVYAQPLRPAAVAYLCR